MFDTFISLFEHNLKMMARIVERIEMKNGMEFFLSKNFKWMKLN